MAENNKVIFVNSVDQLVDSIDKISDDGFFTYGWFKTLESFGRIPSPVYLKIKDKNSTVAIAPCFVDRMDEFFTWGPNLFPFFRTLMIVINKLKIFDRNVLLCYSPACCRTKILTDDHYKKQQIVRLLSQEIDTICRQRKILFSSFLFVSEFDSILRDQLLNLNYSSFPNILTFYLSVQWNNFTDYLNSLKPGMAKKIRREIKKCAENEIVISEEKINEDIVEKLSQLDSNVFSKHSGTNNYRLAASFFLDLQRNAGDKIRLLVARKNERVIGFSLSLQHKKTLDVYMYGADYEAQTNTSFAYFNLVYYKPIQLAIEEGINKIYYRYFLAKSRIDRGCRTEQTFSFVKCHNSLIGPFINNLLSSRYYRKMKVRLLKDFFENG